MLIGEILIPRKNIKLPKFKKKTNFEIAEILKF